VEVTAGAAGTVIVTVPVFVASATEVAVTVIDCAELVAAGAVYVAELVVSLDSDPPPLTLQVTPALFLSLAIVAVSVVVSVPSTVVAAAVTVTLRGFEYPPQPVSAALTSMANVTTEEMITLEILRHNMLPPRAAHRAWMLRRL
jgi:hypothetical protein